MLNEDQIDLIVVNIKNFLVAKKQQDFTSLST